MMNKQKATFIGISLSILLCLLLYGVVEWLHLNRNIPYGNLTRDPNAIHESPKYIGLLSQLGMIFWFSTAGVLLFSYFTINNILQNTIRRNFIGSALFLTLFLGIDDMFMIHDELAHRGLREEYFYTIYVIWLLITLIRYNNLIRQSLYILILLSCFLFGLSILIDKLITAAYLTEDMLKFAGLINWSFYWTSTCYFLIQNRTPTNK